MRDNEVNREGFMRKFIILISLVSILASCSGESPSFTRGSEITEAEMTQKLVELYPMHHFNELKTVMDISTTGSDVYRYQTTVIFDLAARYLYKKVVTKDFLYSTTTYRYEYVKNGFLYRLSGHTGEAKEYTRMDDNGPTLWEGFYWDALAEDLHYVNNDFAFDAADRINSYTEATSKTFYLDEKRAGLSGVIVASEFSGYSFLIQNENIIRINHDVGEDDYAHFQYYYEDFEIEYPNLKDYTEVSNDLYESQFGTHISTD